VLFIIAVGRRYYACAIIFCSLAAITDGWWWVFSEKAFDQVPRLRFFWSSGGKLVSIALLCLVRVMRKSTADIASAVIVGREMVILHCVMDGRTMASEPAVASVPYIVS